MNLYKLYTNKSLQVIGTSYLFMNFYLLGLLGLGLLGWKVRILLIKIGLKVYPDITRKILLNNFFKLLLTNTDREIIVKELYNEYMVRMYSSNTYLYFIPDRRKRKILDEYKVEFGLLV